jgi:hypothetical protein
MDVSQSGPQDSLKAPALEVPASTLFALHTLEAALSKFLGQPPRRNPDRAWERFLTLPDQTRCQIEQSWKDQAAFIQAALDQNLDACDEREMLKFATSKLNLLSDSSLFDRIEKDDVVEILNGHHIQVYRSFSCFSLCNYSLVELACYPWFDLYERSSVIYKQIMDRFTPVMEGNSQFDDLSDLPEYSLRELMTEEGAMFSMREKFCLKVKSALTREKFLVSVKKVRELPTSPVRYL